MGFLVYYSYYSVVPLSQQPSTSRQASSNDGSRDGIDTDDIMRTLLSHEKKQAPVISSVVTSSFQGDRLSSSGESDDDVTRHSSNGSSDLLMQIRWRVIHRL